VKPRVAAAAAAAAAAARRRCVGQWCGECLLFAASVVVSPGFDVRGILNGATTAAGACVAQSVSAKTVGREGASGQEGATCKCRASCAVCKMTRCKLGCPGRVNTGHGVEVTELSTNKQDTLSQDASSDAGVPCRKSRTGAGDQGDDGEANGVRGRERGMQGPGDSDLGEEATPDARSVSALADVRVGCEAGRGSGWRALCWKGEDERSDGSGRRRMLIRGRWSRRSCLEVGGTGLVEPGEQPPGVPESLGAGRRQRARICPDLENPGPKLGPSTMCQGA
jgi:hypothetical protein